MNILDKIVIDKIREVELKKQLFSIKQLEQTTLFNERTLSLSKIIKGMEFGIIAEHKRKSPSKSIINQSLSVDFVTQGYQNAGAAGLSVLTDMKYFGGSLEDLHLAKSATTIPLLRKEFIISEYQIIEAKAHGTDVILLIATILTREEIKQFSELAHSLGLEVLLEVHNREELEKSIMPSLDLIGVNNRNLKTFEVSLDTSKSLSSLIPDDFVKVSESGINEAEAVLQLMQYGFEGFLIGENFMRTDHPGESLHEFMKEIKTRI